MDKEQARILEAFNIAIQMETEGKQFYLKASSKSSNEAGKRLLHSLATEEDTHRKKFEKIYNAIRREESWPRTIFRSNPKKFRIAFANLKNTTNLNVRAVSSERKAVELAIQMEIKTCDYYRGQEKTSSQDVERKFYQRLAEEERQHHLVLLDYQEYLKNPAGYFVVKEHPSLDGV